jgi:hypothetical protein
MLSIFFITHFGHKKTDMKYMNSVEIIELSKADMDNLSAFQPGSVFCTLLVSN